MLSNCAKSTDAISAGSGHGAVSFLGAWVWGCGILSGCRAILGLTVQAMLQGFEPGLRCVLKSGSSASHVVEKTTLEECHSTTDTNTHMAWMFAIFSTVRQGGRSSTSLNKYRRN